MKMFNSGEIPIFARCDMPGVFFGEAIAGPDLPHLTYMIAHNDSDSITKDWNAFRADADWKNQAPTRSLKTTFQKSFASSCAEWRDHRFN